MKYYLKMFLNNETARVECKSFQHAVDARNAIINFNANFIIYIETEE